MTEATATTDHDTFRRWVEAREGRPARVAETADDGGILRIDFGEPEARLEAIDWETFFRVFDDNNLAFLHQEKTADGATSRFFKFIDRS